MKSVSNKLLAWFLLLMLVFVWGSSFILMKRGLVTFSSSEVATLRITITFIFLLPFFIRNIKKVEKKHWKLIALSGLIGNGIPAYLFTKAQTGIDSSLAGILNSLTPLFTLIVGLSFFGQKTKWFNIAGVFIGLAGAIGLLTLNGKTAFNNNLVYGIYVIIATILYAFNINIVKKYLTSINSFTYSSIAFFFIGVPATIYLFSTDFIFKAQTAEKSMESLVYIIILAVVGTALATVAYNYLLKISSVLFAASVTYMMPLVAVLWGVFDGESFCLTSIIWIALILLGVFLVNINRLFFMNRKKKKIPE
jgi:drug/metabolite transporter (DMT)-like permease